MTLLINWKFDFLLNRTTWETTMIDQMSESGENPKPQPPENQQPTTPTTSKITSTPTAPNVTIQVTEEEQKLKDASDTYIRELRLTLQSRVKKEDGTLGEPGALPHDQLVKHYKNEPLDVKE
jgi:hypothetical protein